MLQTATNNMITKKKILQTASISIHMYCQKEQDNLARYFDISVVL